jgi:Grx4 family monothiol glutaredoxin
MTSVKEITSDAEFAHFTSTFPPEALLVIYFHAPWAEPCKQMSTVLATLASTYPVETPAKIGFVSLDAEELPDISETYDVTAVPYIVLQKNNERLDTFSGGDSSKVRALIEKHAGKSGSSGLPPAQQVTKPATDSSSVANGNGSTTDGVKNLSAYAPSENDPSTAPEYTSGEKSKEEVFKRLEGLVKAAPVMLFMKGTPSAPQCGFSRQTVALLRERSIRYGFFNILADDEVRQGLKEFSDWPTFPQLYADGELVGGLDIVSLPYPYGRKMILKLTQKLG